MALHALWYNTLVLWVIENTSMGERSIQEEWTSVELYNRHEFFYETLIVGIITYLVAVIPRALLLDRAELFKQAADNEGHHHICLFTLQTNLVSNKYSVTVQV